MGSTWDLRPIGDRFESTRRARYILTIDIEYQSMSMFLLVEGCLGHFLCIFDLVVLKYEPVQYSTLKNEQGHFSTLHRPPV